MIRVGITGGIGSGKSTLCRRFAARGIAVYDTDREAKRLMNSSGELRSRIVETFGTAAYRDGVLDRKHLAGEVFGRPERLAALNAIVHPAVIADFRAWAERQQGPYVILESAILFSAGLEREVDCTVAVLAPERLRVERTCRRDGADEETVRRRMAAQPGDDELAARADYTVVNILEADLEDAAEQLNRIFQHEAANH